MQRVVLTKFGEPPDVFDLEEFAQASNPNPGNVRIRMEAASINPSDLRLARGTYGLRPGLPHPMGAEGVGRVTQVGEGVSQSLLGKRVLIIPNSEQGTWASETDVLLKNAVPISEKADISQLAMLGINPATAYLMLKQYVHLMPGDWIAQTAANSAVGQYVIALAKLAGLKTVNVVRSPEAAEQVREFGGDAVFVQGEHMKEEIEAALAGETLSLALDPVGGEAIGILSGFLKTGGAIVEYGSQSGQPPALPPRDFIFRGLQMHGFWLSRWLHLAPEPEILDLYRKLGRFVEDGSISALVENTYSLNQFEDAIRHALQPGRGGKVLFKF